MRIARRHFTPWNNFLFAVPFLVIYVWLLVYPLLAGMRLSLFRANLFGGEHFIGLENYTRLLRDPTFLQAMGNSVLFVLLCVPPLVGIALALALALNRAGRFVAFVRSVVFASSVLSVTVLTIVWRQVLTPDGGLISHVSAMLGLPAIAFFSDPHLVLVSMAFITIWWGLGLPMILFLSALQQLPPSVYEAASMDYASPWTVFRRITLPLLTPTLVIVAAYECALQFQLFGQPQLLTEGGPNGASRPMVLYIYETGFNHWDVGYAAAASQILFALIVGVALVPQLGQRLWGRA
ncbi:MAG: sugar ABC transporter permease [Asticcacaulis sp.]|nr:sugar ABC transporter permease [Asticcacaulis sp.]